MRKILSVLFMALFVFHAAMARPVGRTKAVGLANAFLTSKSLPDVAETDLTEVTSGKTLFYVANISGGGFVVLSGDDRCGEILAYAEEGSVDVSSPDSPLNFLFRYWDGQIANAPEQSEAESGESSSCRPNRAMSLTHEPVTPFVTRRWGQGAPYNAEMPTDLTAPSRAVATGCMTTAMAMALSAFPDRIGTTKPIPDYSWDEVVNGTTYHQSYGGVYPSFEVDGDLLKDACYVSGAYKDDAANAQVAKLCRAVAQANKAHFSTGTTLSLERDVTPAFQYFNFEQPQEIILPQISFGDNYHEILYNELAHHRPVLMVGKVNTPGKDGRRNRDAMSFVIDGYDRGDYYHINWGEEGTSNGYYKLCSTRLSEGCGTFDADGYFPTCKLMAWVGIQPKSGSHVKADFYEVEDMSLQYTSLSVKNKTVNVKLCNYFPTEQTFEHGIGVYDEQYRLLDVFGITESVFPAGTYAEVTANPVTGDGRIGNERFSFSYSFDNLPSNARLIPVSRVKGCDTWHSGQCAAKNAYLKVNALGGLDAVRKLVVEEFSLRNPEWTSSYNQSRTLVSRITNNSLDMITVSLDLCFSDSYEGDINGGDTQFRRIQYLDGDYTYLVSGEDGTYCYWDVYPDIHFDSFEKAYAWAEDGTHNVSYWDVCEQKSISIPKNSSITIPWNIATMTAETDGWGHYAKGQDFALTVYTDTLSKMSVPVHRDAAGSSLYPTGMFSYEILDITPAQLYNAGTAAKPSYRAGVFGDDFHIKFRLTNNKDVTFDGFVVLNDRYANVLIEPGKSQDFFYQLNERDLSFKSLNTTKNLLKVSYNRLKTPAYASNSGGMRLETVFEYVDPVSNDASIGKTYKGKVYINADKGIRYWTVDGEMRGIAPAAEFAVPEEAVAVSTALLTEDCVLTPNTNPNTLYYVRNAAEAAGLSGKNVVIVDEVTDANVDGLGRATGRADGDITFTDGHGTYVPYAFTLDGHRISYARKFSKGFAGNPDEPNWEGIVLPFTPSGIMTGNKTLDWFRDADDTGKDLWIARYHGEDAYSVYFKYAEEMKPYIPYLITVPTKAVSKSGGLVGKAVTFFAEGDYTVPAAPKTIFSASRELSFEGTLSGKVVAPRDENVFYLNETNIFDNHYDYYFLNGTGAAFASDNSGVAVTPFHAWFSSRGNMVTEIPTLRIVLNGMARNIADPAGVIDAASVQKNDIVPIYSVNGVLVRTVSSDQLSEALRSLSKGIYIAGGRKYTR